MTPELREGPEAPGAPEWEAAVASAEASVVASGAGVAAGVGAGAGRARAWRAMDDGGPFTTPTTPRYSSRRNAGRTTGATAIYRCGRPSCLSWGSG